MNQENIDIALKTIQQVYPIECELYGQPAVIESLLTADTWTEGQPVNIVGEETDVSWVIDVVKNTALAISAWMAIYKALPTGERTAEAILKETKDWDIPKKKELISALIQQLPD